MVMQRPDAEPTVAAIVTEYVPVTLEPAVSKPHNIVVVEVQDAVVQGADTRLTVPV